MAHVRFSQALREEYAALFASAEVRADKFALVDRIVTGLRRHQARYEAVGDAVGGIPWYFIAAIHSLESNQDFDAHLHNGDPLTARTRQVPAGRPRTGTPPFSWEVSAEDALRLKKLDREEDWSIPKMLYLLEKYNGFGYRLFHPEVLSPYLWSFTNHYTSGKYVADGRFSTTAVSRQCGAATLIRRILEQDETAPRVRPPGGRRPPASSAATPVFIFSNRARAEAEQLQRFMNGFDGVHLRVDGKAGPKTSAAVERLFGFRLHGDPQA